MLIFLYQSRQMINQIIVQKIAWYEERNVERERRERQAMIFPQRQLLIYWAS